MTHRAPLAIEVPLRTWPALERFFSSELSGAGLFLPMDAPPAVGSVLALIVVSPDGARLKLETEVQAHRAARDERRGGVQVVFAPIPAEAREVIARWLSLARGGASSPVDPRPAPAEDRPSSIEAEQTEVRVRLDALAGTLAASDPFAALGIPSESDLAALDRRYAQLVAACHPHHFARYGDDGLKRRATEVFVAMQKAYRVAREMARSREPDVDDDSSVISHADPVQRAISEALQLLDLCQYDAARTAIEAALARDRDDTRLCAMLCVVEGRRLRAAEQIDAALRVYRAVLEYEPEHPEAIRAIEELEIKREQQGGLLRRLFRGGVG